MRLASRSIGAALLLVVLLGPGIGAKVVTLRVSGLDVDDPGPGGPAAKKLIGMFEASHPGIRIEASPLPPSAPGTNWEIKHTQEFVGGVAPDVILAYGAKLWDWAEAGFLLDLAPFAKRSRLDLSKYEQQALNQYAMGDKLYALPRSVSTSVIYYNRDLLAEAGLAPPAIDWTWQDMREYARRLTVRTDEVVQRNGIGFQGTLMYFNPWLRAAGGFFFTPEDRNRILLDSPEAIAALDYLAEMMPGGTLTVQGVWWGPFTESQYAMLYDGTWLLLHFLGLPVQFELGVAPMPVGPAGRAAFLNSDSVVVNAAVKEPEAAWQFASFVAGTEAMQVQLDASPRGIPALAPLWPRWVSAVSRQYPAARQGLELIVSAFNSYTVAEPYFRDNEYVRRTIDAALGNVWSGAKPARIAMEELVPVLNARLHGE